MSALTKVTDIPTAILISRGDSPVEVTMTVGLVAEPVAPPETTEVGDAGAEGPPEQDQPIETDSARHVSRRMDHPLARGRWRAGARLVWTVR